jgi:hypothetical protein
MATETPLFTTPPTIMFVGSDADLADVCAKAMPAVQLLRLGHAAGAVQRMLVTRPLVVIIDGSISAEHAQEISECARDISAGFVRGGSLSHNGLTEAITTAVLDAEQRRARDPVPWVPPPDEEDGDD